MRSEEKKTEDILFYEKKSKARDILAEFDRRRRKAKLTAAAAFVIAAVLLIKPAVIMYDREKLAYAIAIALCSVAVGVISYFAAGSVMQRSVSSFVRWHAVRRKWKNAEEAMSDAEDKYLERTAFEPDVEKAEKRMETLADEVISLGGKEK